MAFSSHDAAITGDRQLTSATIIEAMTIDHLRRRLAFRVRRDLRGPRRLLRLCFPESVIWREGGVLVDPFLAVRPESTLTAEFGNAEEPAGLL